MKKALPYIIGAFITITIILAVFYIKDIYPFGSNTVIYSDLHDQITAFYYHFYDSFIGNKSLFIDFTTSGSINFFGIMAYYILSPVTFILLLFKRENIYLAVSIILLIKVLLSTLTSLYAIKYLFKDKLNNFISVLLALSYAFSGYFLALYLITPWMDAMYLFPLILVGLKKVLDLKKPWMYIVFLTISLICSFYITIMSLIFIFLLSYFYFKTYKNRKDYGKIIASLGISTFIAIGLSFFVIYPAFTQIQMSSRLSLDLVKLVNSKLGPFSDKISFFFPSSLLVSVILLMSINYKKYKKDLSFILPSFFVLLIPYIIEPINKVIHFGSYAMFPNRYGYITFFALVLIAGYFFSKNNGQKQIVENRVGKVFSTILSIFLVIISVFLLLNKYTKIQFAIDDLTFTRDKLLIIIMFISSAVMVLGYLINIKLYNYKSKIFMLNISILLISQIFINSYLYIGLDQFQDKYNDVYLTLNKLYQEKPKDNYFRIKNNTVTLISNNAMVTDIHNLDHFTSLVDRETLNSLKTLGYKSYWTKTFSKNGTMFTDLLLANKYYLSKTKKVEDYKLIKTIDDYNMFEYNKDISYGYFTDNVKITGERSSFDLENNIYKAITGKKDDLFKIYDYTDYNYNNIEINKKYKVYYSIVDNKLTNYIETNIDVKDKSTLYLKVLASPFNMYDSTSYKSFNIYINDKLFMSDYPNKNSNGTLNLGTFANEKINIKMELLKNIKLVTLQFGLMENQKLEDFLDKYKVNSEVDFNKNKINIKVNSEKSGLFFIPISYNPGYSVKINGTDSNIVKVYDNYLGVNLNPGVNDIEFTFFPPKLKTGIAVSIMTLLITLILVIFKLYDKIINIKFIGDAAKIVYKIVYLGMIIVIFIIPIICFVVSYFIRIK